MARPTAPGSLGGPTRPFVLLAPRTELRATPSSAVAEQPQIRGGASDSSSAEKTVESAAPISGQQPHRVLPRAEPTTTSSSALTEQAQIRGEQSDSSSAEVEKSSPRRPRQHQNRASDFEKYLQDERIGLMPDSRDYLFDAIEEVVNESDNGKPSSFVPVVFKDALMRAKAKAASSGYTAEQNWTIAQKCALRLMLRAGVIMTDGGRSIRDGVGRDSTPVSGLVDGFRQICIGYQLERVLHRAGHISHDDDLYYLGLTLYRRGGTTNRTVPPDELKSKADALLSFLKDEGKIEEFTDEEGRVRIQLRLGPRTTSERAAS